MEAHGHTVLNALDTVKQKVKLGTDRPDALRFAIQSCRKGGFVSVPGVYGGALDKFPFGAAFGKGLTFKMGQTHVQKYMEELLNLVLDEKVDLTDVISHRLTLEDGPSAYKNFNEEKDEFIKVVMKIH
jgi:threonine dehydrogenase-like Zn-dependent dehydrogenase